MPAIALVDDALDDARRNARIYAGDILVFRALPALRALCGELAGRLRATLGDDPEGAHRRMPPAELERAAAALRREVSRDTAVQEAFRAVLREAGVTPARTYADGLVLRVQPPKAGAAGQLTTPLAAHRDTWGSNVPAQTNWWAPVMPITAGRGLALFPASFARPVPNDSAEWDLAELLRRRRAGESLAGYPRLPVAQDAPDPAEALVPEIAPGDLLCFSGAHLHASVPNTTERIRFNLEIRTVDGHDARQGRGAPNLDGRAPRVALHWFHRLDDGSRLGDMA